MNVLYPVLLLGLQVLHPLQQTLLGSLHVGLQTRHLDHIQLLLRLRHPDVHLHRQTVDPRSLTLSLSRAPSLIHHNIQACLTVCVVSWPEDGARVCAHLVLLHHLPDAAALLTDDVAMKLVRHLHVLRDGNQRLREEVGTRLERG